MVIPDRVVEQVVSALNIALGVSLVHAKDAHPKILNAALALDDAINDQPQDDDEPASPYDECLPSS
jgi:hypothetical protein